MEGRKGWSVGGGGRFCPPPLSFFPSPFLLQDLDQTQNNAKESLDIANVGSPYARSIQAKECFTARDRSNSQGIQQISKAILSM